MITTFWWPHDAISTDFQTKLSRPGEVMDKEVEWTLNETVQRCLLGELVPNILFCEVKVPGELSGLAVLIKEDERILYFLPAFSWNTA